MTRGRFTLFCSFALLVCAGPGQLPGANAAPPEPAPVVSPEQIRVLEGHKFSVEAEDFSADGKTLITGSRDGSIKIWNPQTGELLHTLLAHETVVPATQPANVADPNAA